MLTEIRKVTQGWVAGGILGLLVIAFAIWGIPHDLLRPFTPNEVASGRGVGIGPREFDKAFENALKSAEERAHRPVQKSEAVAANFHMQVLDELVSGKVLDRLAQSAGIDSSDAQVRREIEALPGFHNQITGGFDAQTFRAALARQGVSADALYRDIRSDLNRDQLRLALLAGVRPPTSFGRMALAFETERRTVSIAAVTMERAPAPPAPTDAQLQAFYKAQAQAFALPEFRAFTLVRADPAAFEGKVDVPEAKIRELFEFRKARLATPEKRSFVVVSGGDRSKAEEASRRLGAGEDANVIARSLGMQAIALTQKTQTDAPDPRIGAAVFATAAGKATPAIEGLTWSAARVTEIVPGKPADLEEVREQLRSELAHEEALTLMNDAVEKFEDVRASGADVVAAATQAGLTISKTPLVEARGLGEDGKPEATVLDQADLLKTVFQAPEGDPTDWVSEPDGGSYLVRIDQLKPAGAPPLAQIRERVAEAWRLQEIGKGMAKIVDDVRAAVRGGASFADTVRAQRLQGYAPGQLITRRNAQQTASPELAGAIFSAREGDVVSGVGGPRGQVMFVAHIEKIERDDPSGAPQDVERLRQSLAQALLGDSFQTVQGAARAEAHVRLNQALIDRTVGKSDNNGEDGN